MRRKLPDHIYNLLCLLCFIIEVQQLNRIVRQSRFIFMGNLVAKHVWVKNYVTPFKAENYSQVLKLEGTQYHRSPVQVGNNSKILNEKCRPRGLLIAAAWLQHSRITMSDVAWKFLTCNCNLNSHVRRICNIIIHSQPAENYTGARIWTQSVPKIL